MGSDLMLRLGVDLRQEKAASSVVSERDGSDDPSSLRLDEASPSLETEAAWDFVLQGEYTVLVLTCRGRGLQVA